MLSDRRLRLLWPSSSGLRSRDTAPELIRALDGGEQLYENRRGR